MIPLIVGAWPINSTPYWEKCFDLISWVYIRQAMQALGFGPFILGWLNALYRLNQPLIRMVLVNGKFSPTFCVRRGIPQGGMQCLLHHASSVTHRPDQT